MASSRPKWSVLQPGDVQEGHVITLAERSHAGWTLDRVQKIIFNPNACASDLDALNKLDLLAAIWKSKSKFR